jgi:uncharacterized protein with HEPN domain
MALKSFSQLDQAYLLDILLAARKAIEFVSNLTFEEFLDSELHQNAVIRPLEIIGEAARKISDDTKSKYPQIPWWEMIGMRNRLIHEYLDVDLSTVWDTIQDDLPDLVLVIEPLIPPED